jgi:hypothetical protein
VQVFGEGILAAPSQGECRGKRKQVGTKFAFIINPSTR